MDLLVVSINAAVVAAIGGIVAWLGKSRFDTLQSSVDAMRSDLTQVALAVGIRPRAQND